MIRIDPTPTGVQGYVEGVRSVLKLYQKRTVLTRGFLMRYAHMIRHSMLF